MPPSAPGSSAWEGFEQASNADDLPPPYTEHANPPPVVSRHAQPLYCRPGGSHNIIQGEGSTEIPPRPGRVKTSRSEDQLAAHISPYISSFLQETERTCASLNAQHPSNFRADLYLVPEEAIPVGEDWQLSGIDYLKHNCNHLQLTRVATPNDDNNEKHSRPWYKDQCTCGCSLSSQSEKQGQKEKDGLDNGSQTTGEPSGVPGENVWWKNETQARWVAEYLHQQLRDIPSSRLEKTPHGEDRKHTCGCECHRSGPSNLRLQGPAEAIEATVRTEEMAFRRESDMGLWESKSGWTIIVSAFLRC